VCFLGFSRPPSICLSRDFPLLLSVDCDVDRYPARCLGRYSTVPIRLSIFYTCATRMSCFFFGVLCPLCRIPFFRGGATRAGRPPSRLFMRSVPTFFTPYLLNCAMRGLYGSLEDRQPLHAQFLCLFLCLGFGWSPYCFAFFFVFFFEARLSRFAFVALSVVSERLASMTNPLSHRFVFEASSEESFFPLLIIDEARYLSLGQFQSPPPSFPTAHSPHGDHPLSPRALPAGMRVAFRPYATL